MFCSWQLFVLPRPGVLTTLPSEELVDIDCLEVRFAEGGGGSPLIADTTSYDWRQGIALGYNLIHKW